MFVHQYNSSSSSSSKRNNIPIYMCLRSNLRRHVISCANKCGHLLRSRLVFPIHLAKSEIDELELCRGGAVLEHKVGQLQIPVRDVLGVEVPELNVLK